MDRDLSASRAILIGNGKFADEARIPPVPASPCVDAMLELLASNLCGWPRARIEIIRDAPTPSELALKVLKAVRDVEDVLVVYYVGHGIRTRYGQLALALAETVAEPEALPHTAMLYDNLAEIMRGCRAATKLVILDCCHAELANKSNFQFQSVDIADAYPVDGLYFVAASKSNHKAMFPADGGLTYFTQSFIDVVRSGIPGQPSLLRLDQIFLQLRARLVRNGLPEPVDSGLRGARGYLFARNAAPSRPVQRVIDNRPSEPVAGLLPEPKGVQNIPAKEVVGRNESVGSPALDPRTAGMLSEFKRTSLKNRYNFLRRIADRRPAAEIAALLDALQERPEDADELVTLAARQPVEAVIALLAVVRTMTGHRNHVNLLVRELAKRSPEDSARVIDKLRTQRYNSEANEMSRLIALRPGKELVAIVIALGSMPECKQDVHRLLAVLAKRPAAEIAVAISDLRSKLCHDHVDRLLKMIAKRPMAELIEIATELSNIGRGYDRTQLLVIADKGKSRKPVGKGPQGEAGPMANPVDDLAREIPTPDETKQPKPMPPTGRRDRETQPQFKLAMRGYDQREVDGFLASVRENTDLPVPAFARVMRGYDPEEVDLYIEHLKALRP